MADFKGSFEKGLAAYEAGENAKAEIRSILDDVGRQLRDATRGRVTVTREQLSRPPTGNALSLLTGLIGHLIEYSALVARLTDKAEGSSGMEELCEFQISPYGYPVTLVYGKNEVKCHDREALERGLMRLLEHPDVGGQLKRLLSLQAPSTNSEARALPPSAEPDAGAPSK